MGLFSSGPDMPVECGPAWLCVPQALHFPFRGIFIAMDTKGAGARSPASEWGWVRRTGEEGPVLPDEQRAVVVRELCYSQNHSFCEMLHYFFPLSTASAGPSSLRQYERVLLSLIDTNCSGFWLTIKSPVTMVQFSNHSKRHLTSWPVQFSLLSIWKLD